MISSVALLSSACFINLSKIPARVATCSCSQCLFMSHFCFLLFSSISIVDPLCNNITCSAPLYTNTFPQVFSLFLSNHCLLIDQISYQGNKFKMKHNKTSDRQTGWHSGVRKHKWPLLTLTFAPLSSSSPCIDCFSPTWGWGFTGS